MLLVQACLLAGDELPESTAAANNTELDVLTWKLQLEPGETKKVRISYSVKYPKDKYVNL